ncbi:flagellar hook-length control protein FliK [Simiduia aestuariiviva]|uniref:Flagellar hook-length control protein FliK n=1 Tax=Simiduia aestuariiviva TaxID=1510459 RepID=A0A839USQ7_9GAMM|nr:flagellar hook-length control protein FliK [Simiduia aestuariiviva]MBB3168417.1 flagellar hook-length control protein FliK [Simiduia aestuariiviva]
MSLNVSNLTTINQLLGMGKVEPEPAAGFRDTFNDVRQSATKPDRPADRLNNEHKQRDAANARSGERSHTEASAPTPEEHTTKKYSQKDSDAPSRDFGSGTKTDLPEKTEEPALDDGIDVDAPLASDVATGTIEVDVEGEEAVMHRLFGIGELGAMSTQSSDLLQGAEGEVIHAGAVLGSFTLLPNSVEGTTISTSQFSIGIIPKDATGLPTDVLPVGLQSLNFAVAQDSQNRLKMQNALGQGASWTEITLDTDSTKLNLPLARAGSVEKATASLMMSAPAAMAPNPTAALLNVNLLAEGKAGAESSLLREQAKGALELSTKPLAQAAGLNVAQPASIASKPLAVTVPVGQPHWGQATGERVLWMVSQKLHSAEIQLDPPELGPLQVKVHVLNDQVTLSFVSQHAQVREALDTHALRLREMLEGQGLDLVDVDVSDQSFQEQRDQAQAQNQNGNGGSEPEVDEDGAQITRISGANIHLVDDFA